MTPSKVSGISKPVSVAAIGFPAAVVAALALVMLCACSKSNTPQTSVPGSDVNLAYGTKVSFGKGGNSERFRTSGWGKTEDQQTRTEGNSAVLNFSGPPRSQPLKLRITLLPFTKEPELPAQPIEVYANGKKVADWQVIGRSTYAASIRADAVSDTGALTLEFRIRKAASPQSLGVSADSRQLGVAAFDLVIEKVS